MGANSRTSHSCLAKLKNALSQIDQLYILQGTLLVLNVFLQSFIVYYCILLDLLLKQKWKCETEEGFLKLISSGFTHSHNKLFKTYCESYLDTLSWG